VNPKQKEAFEILKQKYIKGIPEKIENIRKIIAAHELNSLQLEFHKIKGSGKIYNCDDVSLVAIQIDKHCKVNNPNSYQLAEKACQLLQRIYENLITQQKYDLQNDPLFKEIQ
jgi:HPt (histidine-containing phosphotransfer) domain-containing protein